MIGMGPSDFPRRRAMLAVTVSLALLATPAGGQEVKEGDSVSIHFTCKLPNGQLAVSSRSEQDLNKELLQSKSPLFVARGVGEPLTVDAGRDLAGKIKGESFETAVVTRLARQAVGMKKGEQKTVELTAERVKTHKPGDSILEVAKVRRRARQVRMTPDEFKQRKGAEPQVGQTYIVDPAFPGQVTQVTDKEVVIEHTPPSGGIVETPFGTGRVGESGESYLIEIDARVGALVRSGPLVGRIVEVGEGPTGMITIDYSHPFGGEVLVCEMSLEGFAAVETPQASLKQTEGQ